MLSRLSRILAMIKNIMGTEPYLFVNSPNWSAVELIFIESVKSKFISNLRREFYGAEINALPSQVKYLGLNI